MFSQIRSSLSGRRKAIRRAVVETLETRRLFSEAPFGGTPSAVPGKIEAENYDTGGEGVAYHDLTAANEGGQYRTTEGVDVETCTDTGGGYDVGHIQPTEWMQYTFNAATTGTFAIQSRVASQSGGTFSYLIDGTPVGGEQTLPNTGGWQTYTTVQTSSFAVSAGQHVLRLSFDSSAIAGVDLGNVNWLSFVSVNTTEAPFGGTPWAVPGTVAIDNYDTGGEGVAYHDTTATNDGGKYRTDGVDVETCGDPLTGGNGFDVGHTQPGEWLKYTVNVASAGNYTISTRVASQTGGTFHYEVDGTALGGELTLPNTGGWQTYTTVASTSFSMTAGQHVIRLAMDSSAVSGQDIGNFDFFTATATSLPSISITATSPTANELTLAPGQFTITRTGSTASALTVNYTISGTATNGTDYTTLGSSVNIPAGQPSAIVTVQPINDNLADGTETVILTLASNVNYSVGTPASDTVSIVESQVTGPTVTVSAPTFITSESSATSDVFTLKRTGSTTSALTVNYVLSGTATNGTDYNTVASSAVIPAGSTSVNINVTPKNDGVNEGTESVVLTLSSSSTYNVGTPGTDTVYITDPGTASNSIVSLSLINADTGQPIAGYENILNNQTINLGTTNATSISLRANTNPAVVGSVKFSVNGVHIHDDNNPPYALLGNSGNTYTPWNPGDGTFAVTAQSFTSGGATGTGGPQLNISMTFTGTPTINGWTAISPPPINFDEGQTATVNGKVYLLGTFIDPSYNSTNLAYVYDSSTNKWTQLPNMPENNMTHGSTVVVGSKIWVVGFFSNNEAGPSSNHTWIFDTTNNTWAAGPTLPTNAGGAGGIGLLNNKIYYFTGLTRDNTNTFVNTSETIVLDLANQAAGWQQLKAFPTPRNHLGSAVLNGVIYAIGGQNVKDETAGESNEVDAYNAATDTWTKVANLPIPLGHIATSVVTYNNTILVVDGESLNKVIENTVYQYDPTLNSWANRTDWATPAPRKSPIATIIGNNLYAIAGGSPDPTTPSSWVRSLT